MPGIIRHTSLLCVIFLNEADAARFLPRWLASPLPFLHVRAELQRPPGGFPSLPEPSALEVLLRPLRTKQTKDYICIYIYVWLHIYIYIYIYIS